jgi:hypothetical protein
MTDAFLPFEFTKKFRTQGLTVLSSGLGQESGALLLMLLTNKKIYEKYVGDNHLLILCSDTGNEHDETYEQSKRTAALCKQHGVDYKLIKAEDGFHTPAWQTLQGQYRRTSTMGSAAFQSSACTINLKINVLHKFLEKYVAKKWGYCSEKRGKKALLSLAKDYGKISMLIGFNVEEAKRVQPDHLHIGWERKAIKKLYPLIDLGITRKMTHHIFSAASEKIPRPSSCKFCHFQGSIELYAKYRYDRKTFDELVDIEAAKLKKFAHKGEKNLGFFGTTKTILETLKIAIEKPVKKTNIKAALKEWTKEQLDDYCMSHGHCMSGGY